MKKNIAMRLASGLMLSCLLTTCVISGTFAKYLSEGSAEDSARVAKWGVTVTVEGNNAFFGTAYEDDIVATSGTEVKSSNTKKVLAPGTHGSLGSYSVSGTPEVAVNISVDASLTLTNWEVDGEYYCPIVITVGTVDYYGMDYKNAEKFIEAVEGAIDKTTSTPLDAGTNLGTDYSGTSISWAWNFEGTDNKQTNAKDTALGKLADATTIKFSLKVTVEQVN